MKTPTKRSLGWIATATALIGLGFFLGTLRVDIFTFAQEDIPSYKGPQSEVEKPVESLEVARKLENVFQFVSKRVRPAVVTVYTEKKVQARPFSSPFNRRSPFDRFFEDMLPEQQERSRRVTGLGSGVIIRENGYILTNFHVIKDVDEIQVKLHNEEQVEAKIVGTDPKADLAVLKIDRKNLPSAEFAPSSEVTVGQWAIAIGSPFRLRNTVSIGHVSATHRSITTGRRNSPQYQDFIQTDAVINPGNSGGPLVDIEGRVIGINTMIHSTSGGNQGIGFAVSSDMANRTAQDLIEFGEVKRAWLGVAIQSLDADVQKEHFGEEHGVIVSQVVQGSPAEEAGLKQGDFITHFNGEPVKDAGDLQNKVLSQSINDEVTLRVKRNEDVKKLTVTLAELPDNPSSQTTTPSPEQESKPGTVEPLGMQLKMIPPENAGEHGIRRNEPFFVIKKVKRGSPAAQIGLEEGALLIEVDRRSFRSVESLNQYLSEKQSQGGENVLILVRQGGSFFYQSLPLKK